MRTWIISAFPCMGKTHYVKNHPDTALDSDSSHFSWLDDGVARNPDFPANYVKHIKENIGKCKYIMVSSHKDVRQALAQAGLTFIYVRPSRSLKDEFVQRARERGSSEAFAKHLEDNWDSWLADAGEDYATMVYHSCQGQYLTDVLTTLETMAS